MGWGDGGGVFGLEVEVIGVGWCRVVRLGWGGCGDHILHCYAINISQLFTFIQYTRVQLGFIQKTRFPLSCPTFLIRINNFTLLGS